ncbi:PTS system mannose/fructose/sorbose family transporter subunit IID, partial [Galactobacillus timonensis]
YWSYDMGTKAIEVLTANAREFTHAASLLGVFVVGALTCNYGATSLGMVIPNGESSVDLQALLNGILPAMIPLALTLMCYNLIKKKGWSASKCILLLLVIGIVGCMFGIWSGTYTSLVPVPWHS